MIQEAWQVAQKLIQARRIDKNRNYVPYGTAKLLQQDTSSEIVLSGPAGTGKSRACLEKINTVCWEYPGIRALIVRKTRVSLSETGLVTFEEHVLGLGNPILGGAQRSHRRKYDYPNGSTVVVGGMNKPLTKKDTPPPVMSSEYDIIYVQEATELTEDEWEDLTTRLRNGVAPFQQIIADCNPSTPMHWLKRRADEGRLKMYESRHEDNPTLWNRIKNAWTEKGKQYIAKLNALTGVRYLRLRLGRWVSAEGAVYKDYDYSVHLIDRFEIPRDWRRICSIDFGFNNAFICQWWAIDHDGRMYLYREIYMTQCLVSDHLTQIKELSRSESIEAYVCDHDAEGRATLRRGGLRTTKAYKAISRGIEAIQERLRKSGDGKPRLFILRDCLVEQDKQLIEDKKPFCTHQEIDGYVWKLNASGQLADEPVKKDDHGCDAMRYAVAYVDELRKKRVRKKARSH